MTDDDYRNLRIRDRMKHTGEMITELRANQIKGRCETCMFYSGIVSAVDTSNRMCRAIALFFPHPGYCSKWEARTNETQQS
jgi:hypothetical protein